MVAVVWEKPISSITIYRLRRRGGAEICLNPGILTEMGAAGAERRRKGRFLTGMSAGKHLLYKDDACTWRFSIPEGASASVTLPGESEAHKYGPGIYTLSF